MRKQKGFSLVELLLVVGVILIITAIAVPSYLRSRIRANEASAAASLRIINEAANSYSTSYPSLGFPATLNLLGGVEPCTASPTSACLLDDILTQGSKSGYAFTWTGDGATPSVQYTTTATPQAVGSSGQSMYCSDQTFVIHVESSGSGCTNSSPVMQ